MLSKTKKRSLKKKSASKWLLLLMVLMIGGAGFLIWKHYNSNSTSSQSGGNGGNYINLNPPTSQDRAFSQQKKETNSRGTSNSLTSSGSATNSTTKTTVIPHITTWAQHSSYLAVNGQVSGIAESNGTCKLQLTKDGQSATQTKLGEISGTNTTCGEIDVPLSKLSPGTWQVTLTYTSLDAQGSSATPTNITVR